MSPIRLIAFRLLRPKGAGSDLRLRRPKELVCHRELRTAHSILPVCPLKHFNSLPSDTSQSRIVLSKLLEMRDLPSAGNATWVISRAMSFQGPYLCAFFHVP